MHFLWFGHWDAVAKYIWGLELGIIRWTRQRLGVIVMIPILMHRNISFHLCSLLGPFWVHFVCWQSLNGFTCTLCIEQTPEVLPVEESCQQREPEQIKWSSTFDLFVRVNFSTAKHDIGDDHTPDTYLGTHDWCHSRSRGGGNFPSSSGPKVP